MERVQGQALLRGPEPEHGEHDPRSPVEALLRAAGAATGAGVVTLTTDGTPARLPYPQLLAQARRLLGGLRERGLRAGDVVV
ncbi:hypothetical protein ADL27_47910, partial [Streptomyces sp. NRRL F-6602]